MATFLPFRSSSAHAHLEADLATVEDLGPQHWLTKCHWSMTHMLVALSAFLVVFGAAAMTFDWTGDHTLMMVAGAVWVAAFLTSFSLLVLSTRSSSPRHFELQIFVVALVARLVGVALVYILFSQYLGSPFEPHASDSVSYHRLSVLLADQIRSGQVDLIRVVRSGSISNAGYVIFSAVIYVLFADSLIAVRIAQALIGAATAVLLYRTLRLALTDHIGRTASILFALYPYLLYYTGLHLKETVFIGLLVVTFYLTVKISTAPKRQSVSVALLVITIASLFLFRTFVGVLTIGVVSAHFLLQVRTRRRSVARPLIMSGVVVAAALALLATQTQIRDEVIDMWLLSRVQLERELADKERKIDTELKSSVTTIPLFVGAATIGPLPSLVPIQGQENGAIQYSFAWVRLALMFFAFVGVVALLNNGGRRVAVLLLFIAGYVFVLGIAGLSTSHRFQLPTLPLWLAFTAVGLHVPWSRSRMMALWSVSMLGLTLLVLYWNYFKLSVRALL